MLVIGKVFNLLQNRGYLLPSERAWHASLIESIAREMGSFSYLEIGIYRGETLRKVSKYASLSVGVDIDTMAIKSISRLSNVETLHGTIDDILKSDFLPKVYDLIFIDADHRKESVIHDFSVAKQILSRNGIILLHDTWPKDEIYTSFNFCGDAYKAVSALRDIHTDFSFVTLPIHPGLTICQSNKSLPFPLEDK